MPIRPLICAATALLLAGCASVPSADLTQAVPQLALEPLPADIPSDLPRSARPSHYTIEIRPDAERLTFTGSASVDLQVFETVEALTLHANELSIAEAGLIPAGGGVAIPLTATVNPQDQTVRFASRGPIAPGSYRLETRYSGRINRQANGLFALDYPDKRTGEEVRGLFTQFEAPDARRFAPMFDEPSYKATFDLSAVVPAPQMAVSNMPVASETDLGDGTKRVVFETSPKMSSYLLFFSAGDFERLSKHAPGGTEIGIVAPAGSGEQGRYALDSLAPLLGYYADYFGVGYPLPKLDNVAGPGQSQFFSAMENWGAIFTFEGTLLTDPALTSPARRQRIYTVQAHEAAHQWFGNLVTMAWWDDLWLNEGFASWMETKATDHFHPEWFPLLERVNGRERAMGLDSLVTTHPVVQEIRTVEETNQAFDAIAYQKGEAVVSMLEAYAGEDVWREGIRRYMAARRYGNAETEDLWQAAEAAGAANLTAIANDFTLQPGIPLVIADAQCSNGNTALSLRQSEFSRDRTEEVAANPQSWRVPVLVSAGSQQPVRHVLQGSTTLELPGCDPVLVNSGQLGYFRTLYDPAMLTQLAQALPTLQPIDQLGLVKDNLSLSEAGYQPMAPALSLLAAVPTDTNPVVAANAVAEWGNVYGMLDDEQDRDALASLARELWLPRLQALGFESDESEAVTDANLRAQLIATLGAMEVPAVLDEARTRFAALASDPRALDGPLKATWLAIAAAHATPSDWALLADLAASSTSSVERAAYYQLLGAAHDPALAQRALDLALTDRPGMTTSAAIITSVASQYPELAYDFVMANRGRVDELVDDSGRASFYQRLLASSADPAMVGKLELLRAGLVEDQRKPIDQALVALQERLESRPRIRAGVHEWLASR